MKRYDYYLHRSGGYAFDHFGGIGTPFQVSFLRFYLWKWMGYRATRVIKGASLRRVYIRATIKQGAHRHSMKMDDARMVTA